MHIGMSKDFEKDLLERLQRLADERQLSKLAEQAGVTQSNISRALSLDPEKKQNLGLDKVSKILNALGATVIFPDQQHSAPTIRHLGKNAPAIQADGPESLPIPVYAVAGAGPAHELQAAEPIFTIVAPPTFAKESDFALAIDGESMYPTIKNGAVVGIRQGSKFRQNEIFAVDVPYEGLAVKRVAIDHDKNEYVLRSDNPDKAKYEDIRINIDTAPDLLIGRVIWVWQNL